LRVHAQGDGINGKSHIKDYPSTLKIQGCDNEGNRIYNHHQRAWRQTVLNDLPTRKPTTLTIGTFTFSNPYCKFLKYSLEGTDAKELILSGNKVTYKTNYNEPKVLRFSLRVYAYGHGINGKNHYQDFPTTITVRGCDNEANTISNPSEKAFAQNILNDKPTRGRQTRDIGSFTYSNQYCNWWRFTIEGRDTRYVAVSGKTLYYYTNIREPYTLSFNLRVWGIGGTRSQLFPSTIKLQGCDNEKNVITNPHYRAWRQTYTQESPSRRHTNIGIGGFTYSNHYCKLLKYSINGEDAKILKVSGSTFTYPTNLQEPRTLKYNLRVHA
jgi:hypothetical protein